VAGHAGVVGPGQTRVYARVNRSNKKDGNRKKDGGVRIEGRSKWVRGPSAAHEEPPRKSGRWASQKLVWGGGEGS